ncbi:MULTISPECIES: hypothetical protein [Streptomyces]|uniref:Uncharacterized protein n=1 Tax=Streptomyces asoensis TaxID=249586 RepID=A0ABQ3RS98_9ACTN|nr:MULTISPECIES: hypothetical protein [Streptomyces]MBK3627712.1 hypothetical protein [Streptomyces sp. MBT49]GGQ45522.1 hypothetical protein GCM10010496_03920 [Streptomyces asoensis]GHI58650.1 hypothetical protein Saso_03000 [Streptomyces asoensis]
MSDTSTRLPLSADSQETAGPGRHRGPVSSQDGDAAPHGRHRKPAENRADNRAEATV